MYLEAFITGICLHAYSGNIFPLCSSSRPQLERGQGFARQDVSSKAANLPGGQEPLPPQNGEHETLSVYNGWGFTAWQWKGEIHVYIQSLLGNCNFRVVLFISHILSKKVKNWLPYAVCQCFMLQNHRTIQERISGCHLVQCPLRVNSRRYLDFHFTVWVSGNQFYYASENSKTSKQPLKWRLLICHKQY